MGGAHRGGGTSRDRALGLPKEKKKKEKKHNGRGKGQNWLRSVAPRMPIPPCRLGEASGQSPAEGTARCWGGWGHPQPCHGCAAPSKAPPRVARGGVSQYGEEEAGTVGSGWPTGSAPTPCSTPVRGAGRPMTLHRGGGLWGGLGGW